MQRNILVDLLRILLLAWIVLFHYTVRYNEIYADTLTFPFTFENGGTVGVALFFIISGFFMAPSLFRSESRGAATFASYCGQRFMRFWPLYIICCIAIVGSQQFLSAGFRDCTLGQFFQNLFIFKLGSQRVDGAHWFLETLLVIQFLFALALFVPRETRLNILMTIVGVNILCTLLFVATDIKIFDRIAKIIGGRYYLWCAFIGIILYLIINRKQIPKGSTGNKVLIAACSLAAATWIVVFAKQLGCCIWFPIYTTLFIVALTWHPQIPAKTATFVTAGGAAMLAWYLVHQNIGYAIILALKTRGADPWLMIAAAACVTFALALVCIRIERGVKKLLPVKKR